MSVRPAFGYVSLCYVPGPFLTPGNWREFNSGHQCAFIPHNSGRRDSSPTGENEHMPKTCAVLHLVDFFPRHALR